MEKKPGLIAKVASLFRRWTGSKASPPSPSPAPTLTADPADSSDSSDAADQADASSPSKPRKRPAASASGAPRPGTMAAQVEELRARLATAEAELIERSREAKAAILAEKERAAEVAAEAASRRGIENRIGSLEAQLDDAASKLKRTEEVLRNVCAERDQFRQRATDNSDTREALKAAEFEISKLRTDADLMQKRVDDAQSRVDPLLAELKETKSLLDSLAADRNALASHKSSLEQSSSAVAPLQAEVARLRRRLDELDADNSRLQNALNGAQSAAQAARTAAAASAREADVLRLRLEDALKDKPVILSGRKILTSPKLPPTPPA